MVKIAQTRQAEIVDTSDRALVGVGRALQRAGYRFTTITPESHRRVNERPANAQARDLRGVLGWSRPFVKGVIPDALFVALEEAGMLQKLEDGRYLSTIRFSTIGDALYVHSAFPTIDADSVFFGPDTYRFVSLLRREVTRARRLVDIGCGSGAGGLSLLDRVEQAVLTDVNPTALRFAKINAEIQGVLPQVEFCHSDGLAAVEGDFDLVVANPPYLVDERNRTYRSGGPGGFELSVRIAEEALGRLAPGGRLVLYTATPIIDGRDLLHDALQAVRTSSASFEYRELDPDVFGEELERPAYQDTERLSLVCCTASRR